MTTESLTPEQWRNSPEGKSAASVCIRVGCSGMTERCPGNPHCEILVKAVESGVVDDIVDAFMDEVKNG